MPTQVKDTVMGSPKLIGDGYKGMVKETTGRSETLGTWAGVIHDTKAGIKMDKMSMKSNEKVGKTQPKRYGQVPMAGPMY